MGNNNNKDMSSRNCSFKNNAIFDWNPIWYVVPFQWLRGCSLQDYNIRTICNNLVSSATIGGTTSSNPAKGREVSPNFWIEHFQGSYDKLTATTELKATICLPSDLDFLAEPFHIKILTFTFDGCTIQYGKS
ncbi:hypothetical protein ACFFRR_002767 [Megaselia abdita]